MILSDSLLYSSTIDCHLNCLNGGSCKVKNLLSNINMFCSICLCPKGFYGRLCQYTASVFTNFKSRLDLFITSLPNLISLTDSQSAFNFYGPQETDCSNIFEILRLIVTMSELLTDSIINLLVSISKSASTYYRKSKTYNEKAFELYSAA